MAPPRGPTWLGVKVTLIVQLAPGATWVPQLCVRVKSGLLLTRLLMFNVAPPVLVKVIGNGLLDVPTG